MFVTLSYVNLVLFSPILQGLRDQSQVTFHIVYSLLPGIVKQFRNFENLAADFQKILVTVRSNQQKGNRTERMLGRNPSRRNFGGRGGRGFKNKNNYGRRKVSTKKTLADFTFDAGSAKQASDYENTELFVINHIKKDFNRGTIRKLEYKNMDNWYPILKASTFLDEYVKGREDRHFELQFKADYR